MHLRIFGCKCYVHNNGKDASGKFDPRSDEAIFLRYSSHSKAYKVFNKRTLCVEESVHILFDESNSLSENDAQEEDFELGLAKEDLGSMHGKGKNHSGGSGPEPGSKEEGHDDKQTGGIVAKPCLQQNQNSNPETGSKITVQTGTSTNSGTGPSTDPAPSSSESQTIEDLSLRIFVLTNAFLSNIEPKNVYEALVDSDWITAMQEELHQFERNKVLYLVPRPKDRTIIGTKWVFRNKLDE